MIDYHAALDSFPSYELVKRVLVPAGETQPDVIESVKVLLQMAIFSRLAESDLDTRIDFVKKGKCILLPFRDRATGYLTSITFNANIEDSRVLDQDLASELHALAEGGIDVDGLGVVRVEGDSVAYIPNKAPEEPTYGNITLFDPYHTLRRKW